MSLLMDALRKAEESKKRAEQKGKTTSATEAIAPAAELISPEQTAVSKSADQFFANDDKPEPAITEPPRSTIDVSEQAADSETIAMSVQSDGIDKAEDKDTSFSSFELEPKLQTTARTQSYTEDQLQISTPVVGEDKVEAEQESLRGQDKDSDSISSFLSSAKLDQAVSEASAELAKQSLGAVTEPAERKPGIDKKAAINIPQVTAEPVAESIVDRTASSRRSAKSVFSAKKLGKKRDRKFTIAAAGIAALLVIGLGFFLTILLMPSSGISIPSENFPVSQSFESTSSINGSVTEEEGIASLAAGNDSSQNNTDTSSLQNDVSFGFDTAAATGNTEVAVISEQSVSQETLDLVRNKESSVDQQALLEANPDIPASSPVRLSNVVVDGSIDEIFVVGDSVTETVSRTAPSAESNVATSDTSITVDSSIINDNDLPIDGGGSLSVASNALPRTAPAARELVSFRRTDQQQTIAPALTEGFRAYQNGDLDIARDLYEQTLVDTPENIDALLGLAAIASSSQEISLAMGLYSRALSLDPSNALAKTAIRSLAPLGTPAEQERELRKLDVQNPNVAPLAFVLGNFYASQSRWPDAQRYYFKALQLAKSDSQSGSAVSPDYAFNLAVSLERLNQVGPALSFYEEALALATRYPSNFDLSIARARLESLSRKNSL